jgi:hypothetical protein
MIGAGHGRNHVIEVRPQFRMVRGDLVLPDPREQYDGPAVRVGELSEQMLIGTHAKRLIIVPDDQRHAGGSRCALGGAPASCPAAPGPNCRQLPEAVVATEDDINTSAVSFAYLLYSDVNLIRRSRDIRLWSDHTGRIAAESCAWLPSRVMRNRSEHVTASRSSLPAMADLPAKT